MTATDKKLSAFADLVATCVPSLRGDAFAPALIAGLRNLVPIEDATVLYYAGGDLPVVVYRETPEARGVESMERFTAGAFLLDPFYQTATDKGNFGLFLLKDLAPEDFEESEYYRSWFSNCGFSDECGFIIEVGPDAHVNVALGRLGKARFTGAQVNTLRCVQPAVEALCREHWASAKTADTAGVESGEGVRRQLHLALDDFGSSMLTEREAQVINMVLHGHSTKSVAERLGISVETVKLHRKHAYAKLEVGSQAELFYLFLDSLMSARDYQGGDTLVSYMQKPVRAPEQSTR